MSIKQTALALAIAVRFGAVTEFGFGYQLSVWDMTEYPKGRLAHLHAVGQHEAAGKLAGGNATVEIVLL